MHPIGFKPDSDTVGFMDEFRSDSDTDRHSYRIRHIYVETECGKNDSVNKFNHISL